MSPFVWFMLTFGSIAALLIACYSLSLKGLDTSRVDIAGEVVTIFLATSLLIGLHLT